MVSEGSCTSVLSMRDGLSEALMGISPASGRIRTLSASSRARREKRRVAQKRQRLLAGGGGLALIIAAPLAITAYMGVEAGFPGMDAAKSLMAMLQDRSPGDRTAAELTKTKKKTAAPEQRALGKINKPENPPEFVDAILPPPVAIEDVPSFPVALAGLGPLVEIPPPPHGGGGIVTSACCGGGGGGGTENPPPEKPPVENPPTDNPPVPNPHNNPPPAVPEPNTWATMLLGFGLTGWLVRRRRRRDRAAIYA